MNLGLRAFSTDEVPASTRLGAWRDFMSQVYYCVDVKPSRNDEVRGELHEAVLGPIGLSNYKSNELRVFRYAEAAKEDGAENFVFIFPLKDQLFFDQRGRSGFIDPGDVVLLNSSEYYEAGCSANFENLTLKIPCPVLRARLPTIDSLCARQNVANRTLSATVGQMAVKLMKPELPWSPETAERLSGSILDLIGLMLETAHDPAPQEFEDRSLAHMMFKRFSIHMKEHLSDCDLSPAKVAQAHRISLRYLFKIYKIHGTTFGHELMELRLQEARRQILIAYRTGHSLQQIAFLCGFSSQSHFSTRYRERFGESPRESRWSMPAP
jgi:AraC family transcriptional activator of tynA and feaB